MNDNIDWFPTNPWLPWTILIGLNPWFLGIVLILIAIRQNRTIRKLNSELMKSQKFGSNDQILSSIALSPQQITISHLIQPGELST